MLCMISFTFALTLSFRLGRLNSPKSPPFAARFSWSMTTVTERVTENTYSENTMTAHETIALKNILRRTGSGLFFNFCKKFSIPSISSSRAQRLRTTSYEVYVK